MLSLSLTCLGAVMAVMLVLWLVSLALKDASIVDIFWGPNFALIAWLSFALGGGAEPRRWLMAALVSAWGLRLGIYLARRNHGRGEDPRYQEMRRRIGPRFPLISLGSVFCLQGAILCVVSLPVQAAAAARSPAALTWIDGLGAAVWAVGLFFEAVGDAQLARFRRDPANRGKVMDQGLWRYTRHPNYFGDFLVWWGLYLPALATGAWWTAIGPALMSFLLMRVSGVPLLEQAMRQRPGYAEYVARTSGFFPRPPRRDRAAGS